MPNSQRARKQVVMNGKASSVNRKSTQTEAATRNKEQTTTPWEKSKAQRLANRQATGKTFANWSKNQTYKTTGPNSVAADSLSK